VDERRIAGSPEGQLECNRHSKRGVISHSIMVAPAAKQPELVLSVTSRSALSLARKTAVHSSRSTCTDLVLIGQHTTGKL